MSGQAVDFGRYRLLPDQRLLVEGEIPVPLGGRAFDILMALVDRHSEVISKDELMRRVWSGQVVEENTLAVHLSALRKALGDGKQGTRYIATVAGRGYRFVAPVEAAEMSPEPAVSGNLPRAATPLVGREEVLAQVVSAIGPAPLVTLTGPGGIGKTRLALAVGERVASLYPDGVWWVDLTAAGDPALVAGTVARALGIQLGDAPPLPRLIAGLKGQPRLLILDNCEHVIAGVAELAVVLREVADIRLLATSQEPLNVAGEQVERLGPLAVPAAEGMTVAMAATVPSVELFVARARAVTHGFALDDANVGAVVRMCRRLEGIPLALELAAARAALLGAEPVAQRLDGRLLELSSGRRDTQPKHQTLRALLDWSHGLLSAEEQTVLRRLAVFAGGCTLEAVEAVAADAAVPDWRVAEHIASLIAKSLVIAERTAQGARYRLLETTRTFAAEQLEASREGDALAERHARYFMALFERADAAWETTPELAWRRLYSPELDNTRKAMVWALCDLGRADIAIALGGAAGRLWGQAGAEYEGMLYLDRAVERINADTPLPIAARALARAALLRVQRHHQEAVPFAERSVALYHQFGDRLGMANMQVHLGFLYAGLGRTAEAKITLRAAHKTLSLSHHKKSILNLNNYLSFISVIGNNYVEARDYLIQALAVAREAQETTSEYVCLANLAEVEFATGFGDRAVTLLHEAAHGFRQLNRRINLASTLIDLASCLILQDAPSQARPFAEEAFCLLRENDGSLLKICSEQWALLGALDGRLRESARILGFTDAGIAGSGLARRGAWQQIYERLVRLLEGELPAADLLALTAEGAQWSEGEARDFAFRYLISTDSSSTEAAGGVLRPVRG